jgi:hypothetical protein
MQLPIEPKFAAAASWQFGNVTCVFAAPLRPLAGRAVREPDVESLPVVWLRERVESCHVRTVEFWIGDSTRVAPLAGGCSCPGLLPVPEAWAKAAGAASAQAKLSKAVHLKIRIWFSPT